MGYMSVMGACIGCGTIFSFSASKVPSVVVNGSREPICEACVKKYNPIREAKGLPPIVPLPGAYDADEVD